MWARAHKFLRFFRHLASRVRARGYYVASGAGGVKTPPRATLKEIESMKHDVFFEAAPAIGTKLRAGGVSYEAVAVSPYHRADGQLSKLITWRAQCADCGQPFDFRTGLVCKYLNRRCAEHRAPGRAASASAQRKVARHFAKKGRA